MSGGALPNLLVIGAMKCGTSSLHSYLRLHPDIQMSRPKETHFFIDRDDFDPSPFITAPGEERLFGEPGAWRLGIDWYRGHFDPEARIRGESTVAYTYPWYPGTAERVAATVPEARLIYLVRDPVARIASHYLMYRDGGREWRPLADAVARPNNCYVAATRYATALAPFLERFPRERIHLVRQDELLSRRRETLQVIFRFLEVDDSFWTHEMEHRRGRAEARRPSYGIAERAYRSRLGAPLRRLPPVVREGLRRALTSRVRTTRRSATEDAELRRRLLAELEPELARLEDLTGWDLDAWRDRSRP
jgi:hypothetical protein